MNTDYDTIEESKKSTSTTEQNTNENEIIRLNARMYNAIRSVISKPELGIVSKDLHEIDELNPIIDKVAKFYVDVTVDICKELDIPLEKVRSYRLTSSGVTAQKLVSGSGYIDQGGMIKSESGNYFIELVQTPLLAFCKWAYEYKYSKEEMLLSDMKDALEVSTHTLSHELKHINQDLTGFERDRVDPDEDYEGYKASNIETDAENYANMKEKDFRPAINTFVESFR